MPILPPISGSATDTVYNVMLAAKARLNDAIKTLSPVGGRLLENTAVFTQVVVNTAWRNLQEFLANIGYTPLKQEAIIPAVPVVATLDPALSTYINWTNYCDGVNVFTTPTLPADMILPLKMWERPYNMNAMWGNPMELFFDGLPNRGKQTWNGAWEWRANSIYMPGALQIMDLRLMYMRFLGDFLDTGNTQWFEISVPLVRCQNAFSLFICAEIAAARDDMDPGIWKTKAENAAKEMINREVSMKARGNIRRQSRSGRLEAGRGMDGYGW